MQAEYDLLALTLAKLKAPPRHNHNQGNIPEAGGREKALAITNLEQAIMWLIKSANLKGIEINELT